MNELDRIVVIVDDITGLEVDAIVNAADEELNGGGGVDGAIHRAAGPDLLKACLETGGCRPGRAVATAGFELNCRHVIHAVGPVWRGGSHGEAGTLRSCYEHAFLLAGLLGCRTIAFPCISTGVFGYPREDACSIAVEAARAHLRQAPDISVVFCCFSAGDGELYRRRLGEEEPDRDRTGGA